MKRLIEKLKKWQLPALIMNTVIFYVVVVLSLIGVLENFAYKNLWWGHYVLTVACIALTVTYFKKIFRHVIKIKRGGFD